MVEEVRTNGLHVLRGGLDGKYCHGMGHLRNDIDVLLPTGIDCEVKRESGSIGTLVEVIGPAGRTGDVRIEPSGVGDRVAVVSISSRYDLADYRVVVRRYGRRTKQDGSVTFAGDLRF